LIKERAALSCLPLLQTKALVIKFDPVGVQKFTVDSIDTKKLRREAQYLAKLLITFPQCVEPFFPERLYDVILL
jgi:hypothetical protein